MRSALIKLSNLFRLKTIKIQINEKGLKNTNRIQRNKKLLKNMHRIQGEKKKHEKQLRIKDKEMRIVSSN